MFRQTGCKLLMICITGEERTVRLLKDLLTLAKRAKSFTDNSGSRYSSMTSVGTSSSPVLVFSDGMSYQLWYNFLEFKLSLCWSLVVVRREERMKYGA